MANTTRKNECGECTACCHVLGIRELSKPQYETCRHVNTQADGSACSGCGIYNFRPNECRSYECHWLGTDISEDFRPDRCGVILEPSITKVGPAIVVREVVPGAVEIDSNREYIMDEARKIGGYIYIMRAGNGPGSRSILVPDWVPPDQVEKINQTIFQTEHHDGSVTQDNPETVQVRIPSELLSTKTQKRDKLKEKRKKKRKAAAKARKRNRV